MILSLVDPNYDSSKGIDEDHLYAESILRKNINFSDYKDKIANLNLLQAKENRKEKNDMMLDEYIEQLRKQQKNPSDVIKFLPTLDNELTKYSLDNFLIFYNKRKKLIGDDLENILS